MLLPGSLKNLVKIMFMFLVAIDVEVENRKRVKDREGGVAKLPPVGRREPEPGIACPRFFGVTPNILLLLIL